MVTKIFAKYKLLGVILILILISLWSVWPFVKGLNDSLVIGSEDLIVTWILNQTIQKIPLNLEDIFKSNIFYPYKNTLTYSVLLIPSAVVSYIPVAISKNPVTAFNFTLVFGQVVTLVITFLWFRDITEDVFTSFVATIVMGFSQIRFGYLVHLQMWSMYWWLVSAWMFWRFINYKKNKYLYISFLFAGIQAWENPLPVFFILVLFISFSLFNYEYIRKNLKNIFKASLLFSVIVVPVVIAYFTVSTQFNYVRPIREVAHFSASLNDFWGVFLSPGLYLAFFISLMMISIKDIFKNSNLKAFGFVLLISAVFSLGPVLKWNAKTFKIIDKFFVPLPYGIFYYMIPGLKGLRTPSRWIWLFAFCMSAICAILITKYKSKHKKYILFLLIVFAVFGGTRLSSDTPVHKVQSPNEYPQVYRWLGEQSGEVILELPAYGWSSGEEYNIEMNRMLYSLEHKKFLLNGASGYTPPERESLLKVLSVDFPKQKLEEKLLGIGVDFIVVMKDKVETEKLDRIREWGVDKLVWEDGEFLVYKL